MFTLFWFWPQPIATHETDIQICLCPGLYLTFFSIYLHLWAGLIKQQNDSARIFNDRDVRHFPMTNFKRFKTYVFAVSLFFDARRLSRSWTYICINVYFERRSTFKQQISPFSVFLFFFKVSVTWLLAHSPGPFVLATPLMRAFFNTNFISLIKHLPC